MLNIEDIRVQFPILHQDVNGYPLVYLDNAATSQKPQIVLDAINRYYTTINSNVHRGTHYMADLATRQFEQTRETVKDFLGAASTEEIIFTKGTTESINLVAATYGRQELKKGDEVIISTMEHHSNIVPWQMICKEKGATLKVIPIDDNGELIFEEYIKLLSDKTKIVSVNHASNSLGTINDIENIIKKAHEFNAVTVIDGAQGSVHLNVEVQKLDCDFYAFSSHKIYGPTGIGVLYGKKQLLEKMPPYMGGGEMISEVSFEKTTYNELPYKFEAGTPNIGDIIALKYALNFVNEIGKENIEKHEQELLTYATEKLQQIPSLKIIGNATNKISVISFNVEGVHHYDLGVMLDANGIAVRTGYHCTEPLMKRFGIDGTVRASFAVYNTKEEIDKLAEGILKVIEILV